MPPCSTTAGAPRGERSDGAASDGLAGITGRPTIGGVTVFWIVWDLELDWRTAAGPCGHLGPLERDSTPVGRA